ncbi:MAG: GNAT family N-acetyltransferase [Novosphingobium sp. 35-62-5]|nr:MAG: GNAT family N-acetyltransferase [Novosphingobium sp. 35-62-5]HQS97009.1 GNAT family N-acetyltransferase [Novosphingobium sp.]
MFIRSERLFLRPGWPEDWAELHALIDDEAVVRNLSRAPWPYGPDDAKSFVALPQANRHPHFFVTLPGAHGSRLVGCVGLAQYGQETELGYWIGRQHWGRGYATEAARAVLSLARSLGHRRVIATPFADNAGSARVLAKSGFRATGEVRKIRSPARSEPMAAMVHAVDLAAPLDCDGPKDGGFASMRRAA